MAARAGDEDGAMAIYRELIAKDAGDAEAWMNLGRFHLRAKHFADAAAAFTAAAKGEAQRPVALYNLACTYALAGELMARRTPRLKNLAATRRVAGQRQRGPEALQ